MKESRSTPPASPAHSLSSVSSLFPGPGAAKLGNNLTDSPVSLASGLAPGSYPHPASGYVTCDNQSQSSIVNIDQSQDPGPASDQRRPRPRARTAKQPSGTFATTKGKRTEQSCDQWNSQICCLQSLPESLSSLKSLAQQALGQTDPPGMTMIM